MRLLVVFSALSLWAGDARVERMMDERLTVAQRNDACYELRGVTTAEVINAMRRALNDPKVRACAGVNLWKAGAVDAFAGALSDDDPEVRAQGARMLGAFQRPEYLDPLGKAARDPHMIVAVNAMDGLMQYPPAVVTPVLLGLATDGGIIGTLALNRLTQWREPRVVPIARSLLSRKEVPDVLAAVKVLGEMGDASDLPALRLIAEKDTEAISNHQRGFGFMPAISLSRAAKTAIAQIQPRMNANQRE